MVGIYSSEFFVGGRRALLVNETIYGAFIALAARTIVDIYRCSTYTVLLLSPDGRILYIVL